jgi:hypothetical protein
MPKYGFGEPIIPKKKITKQEIIQKKHDTNETNIALKKPTITQEEKELKELNISNNSFLWKLVSEKNITKGHL